MGTSDIIRPNNMLVIDNKKTVIKDGFNKVDFQSLNFVNKKTVSTKRLPSLSQQEKEKKASALAGKALN